MEECLGGPQGISTSWEGPKEGISRSPSMVGVARRALPVVGGSLTPVLPMPLLPDFFSSRSWIPQVKIFKRISNASLNAVSSGIKEENSVFQGHREDRKSFV